VSNLFREYQFRKTFGGSHEDYLSQPREITDWLLEIEKVMNEVRNG